MHDASFPEGDLHTFERLHRGARIATGRARLLAFPDAVHELLDLRLKGSPGGPAPRFAPPPPAAPRSTRR
jgi:hypothetical protein